MDIGFGVVKKPLIKAMSQGIEYYPLYENTWRGLRRLCFCIPRFIGRGAVGYTTGFYPKTDGIISLIMIF